MTKEEIEICLAELRATEKRYKKDEMILMAGDTTERFGLVLEGSVTIESNDIWGNRTILSHVGNRQFFAETYALLKISAHKNVVLSGRSFHISPRTIRERILSYLNTVSLQKHRTEFDIPFDRQQLADYLNVDRSALSNELSKLQREGIISCRKNHFELLSH